MQQYIIKVRLLLKKDKKVLMLEKSAFKGGGYGLIGGKVEPMESAKQALIREANEEANIVLNPASLNLVHTIHHSKRNQSVITLIFEADLWKGKVKNKEPKLHKGFEWYSLQKIPFETTDHLKHALTNYRKGIPYSEYNWKDHS